MTRAVKKANLIVTYKPRSIIVLKVRFNRGAYSCLDLHFFYSLWGLHLARAKTPHYRRTRARLSRTHPWRLVLDVFYPLWGLHLARDKTPLHRRTRVRLSRPHPWRLVLDVFYPLWGLHLIQTKTPLIISYMGKDE